MRLLPVVAAICIVACGSNPFLYTAEAVTKKVLTDALSSQVKTIHSRLDTLEDLIRSQQASITMLVRSQRRNADAIAKLNGVATKEHNRFHRLMVKLNGKKELK